MSAWIEIIDDQDADEHLRERLAAVRSPHGTVDNVMRVHSLRPDTMHGHFTLYQAALHNSTNTLPPWLQETISSYVSILNDCAYSLANHWANARHLVGDDDRAHAMEQALHTGILEPVFSGQELLLLEYARKLTCTPQDMVEADVLALRKAGFDDGQILETNQIVSYFNYVNRVLNGLGVTTSGDVVGYYAED